MVGEEGGLPFTVTDIRLLNSILSKINSKPGSKRKPFCQNENSNLCVINEIYLSDLLLGGMPESNGGCGCGNEE